MPFLAIMLVPILNRAQTFEFSLYTGAPFDDQGYQLLSMKTPIFGLGATRTLAKDQLSIGLNLEGQNTYQLKLSNDTAPRSYRMNAAKILVAYNLSSNLGKKEKIGFRGSKVGGVLGLGMSNVIPDAPFIIGLFCQPTFNFMENLSIFGRTEFTYMYSGNISSTGVNILIGLTGSMETTTKNKGKPKNKKRY